MPWLKSLSYAYHTQLLKPTAFGLKNNSMLKIMCNIRSRVMQTLILTYLSCSTLKAMSSFNIFFLTCNLSVDLREALQ